MTWHKLYTTMELVPVPLVPTCAKKWVYKAVEISSIVNSNLHIQIKNLNICTTHRKTHGKSRDFSIWDHKTFAPAIVGVSGQIHADILRLLWVLADNQMRSYYESMGKEDKIGTEAFRWARAKVFNCSKASVGRAIAFGCATR